MVRTEEEEFHPATVWPGKFYDHIVEPDRMWDHDKIAINNEKTQTKILNQP